MSTKRTISLESCLNCGELYPTGFLSYMETNHGINCKNEPDPTYFPGLLSLFTFSTKEYQKMKSTGNVKIYGTISIEHRKIRPSNTSTVNPFQVKIENVEPPIDTFCKLPNKSEDEVKSPLADKRTKSTKLSKENKILNCGQCSRTFTKSYNYYRHQRTHLAERILHECNFCKQKFTEKDNLQRHIR